MTDNLPMTIPKSGNQRGYVYIAKINKYFDDTEGCYKIGSTNNVNRRMHRLSDSTSATINLIAYGYSNYRLSTERFLQTLLKSKRWYDCENDRKCHFWWSKEHFDLSKNEVEIAINMLDLISASCVVFCEAET